MLRPGWLPRAAALLFALLPAIAGPPPAGAEEYCDPNLLQSRDNPLGYRLRGDRCEGLYVKEVAGSAGFVVVSFAEPPEPLEVSPGKSLRVEWTSPPGNAPLRLRASALRRRLYYRMDTVRPQGTSSYVWPADTLAALKILGGEIGIVGWTSYPVGNRKQEVYVPLRIGAQPASARSQRYALVLVPGADLAEVFVSLSMMEADGRVGASVKRDDALGHGYYPAERPISVTLPHLKRQGTYHIEIGAILRQGGSTSKSLFFYHPGG